MQNNYLPRPHFQIGNWFRPNSMADASTSTEIAYVVVVDDDSEVCQSIAWTLNSVGYSVQTYPSVDAFLAQPVPGQPLTVLIDLLLPGMTGLGLCREILARDIPCVFAVISGHADVPTAVEAMKLGAIDLLEKPFGKQRLLEVVSKATATARERSSHRHEAAETLRRLESLSPREREIFDAIASGLVTKEIAKRLEISGRTVDVHRSRIMQKLGIESPLQIANILAIVKQTSS